jgi:ABC-type spermidine/putrescine transport system permease subunit II
VRRWPARLLRLYIALMCVFLLAPIVIVVILAFSGEGYLALS